MKDIEFKPLTYELINETFQTKTVFNHDEVREVEANYKEAIEALIDSTIELVNIDYNIASRKRRKNATVLSLRQNKEAIDIIEKATGKLWEELIE